MNESPQFIPPDTPEALRELYAMYCALVRADAHHPSDPLPYSDFAQWVENMEEDERFQTEAQLRDDYQRVLRRSITSGIDIVRKYLFPRQRKAISGD